LNRPLVSIVTTSYNQAEFLEETIASVLAQDYQPLEYLVIDDGSTDASPDIIRRYVGRLTWWSVQENRGQVAALNAAFARARGDILNFVNSDDTLLPGSVSQVVDAFEREPGLVAVYGDVYLTNERSERVEYGVAGTWDMARMARTVYTPHQPSTFWSRRAWQAAGPFNERAWALFDVEFNLRVGLLGDVRYLPTPLATFRLHSESKSLSRHRKMAEECLRFSDEFFAGPGLAAELRPYARAARATLYRRAALHYQADREVARARRLFLRSLLLSTRGMTRKQLRRLARTLVPEPVARRIRRPPGAAKKSDGPI
jgi:glycosyltransferase involved in cell wall biosynthesis